MTTPGNMLSLYLLGQGLQLDQVAAVTLDSISPGVVAILDAGGVVAILDAGGRGRCRFDQPGV